MYFLSHSIYNMQKTPGNGRLWILKKDTAKKSSDRRSRFEQTLINSLPP